MLARDILRMTLAVGWLLLACAGCDDGRPKTYPVTGTVTYQNQPVGGAQVMFTSASGRAAEGITGEDGKFSLTTYESGDGALPGQHKVTITKVETIASTDPSNPYGSARNLLPARYGNPAQSPLSETVKEAPNDYQFDLTDG